MEIWQQRPFPPVDLSTHPAHRQARFLGGLFDSGPQVMLIVREGIKKRIDFFLGKSTKLWVGGGQES